MTEGFQTTRRQLLASSAGLFAWAHLPKVARAEGNDPRLLVFVLRGALDGLATIAPFADPSWEQLRGPDALGIRGGPVALPLDNFFALNSAMPQLHALYQAREAVFFHAIATPYRERSHFDGQNILDSGFPAPGVEESGWLNRALCATAAEGCVMRAGKGLAIGPTIPLLLRGPAPIVSWYPQKIRSLGDATLNKLLDLYRHTDARLAQIIERQIGIDAIARIAPPLLSIQHTETKPRIYSTFSNLARNAARFFSQPEGPRVGAIVFDGWDTHANEGESGGHLSMLLGALDGAISSYKVQAHNAWKETVIVIITEFGRTARINGTNGTDHGTATVALLVGGALRGGRVIADWPGLRERDLYEGRDLLPTIDLRAVLKGVLRDHLRVPEATLESTIFPDSASARTVGGLFG
jgi:uncharacterized protein (DUF1501 family)